MGPGSASPPRSPPPFYPSMTPSGWRGLQAATALRHLLLTYLRTASSKPYDILLEEVDPVALSLCPAAQTVPSLMQVGEV